MRTLKKNVIFLYIVLMFMGAYLTVAGEQASAGLEVKNGAMVIPDEAIRLRILANSDSEEDQELKRKIRDRVNEEITVWVEGLTSMENAREVIQGNIPEIEKIVEEVMVAEGLVQEYNVDFGRVDFPTKMYGKFIYPAGDYEAILITLGEGTGANWWCVLFPPLCFLDFSNGEATATPFEEEETGANAKESKSKKSASILENDTEMNVTSASASASAEPQEFVVDEEPEEVEVKFFVFEALSSLWEKITA
ncbi:stage II sporulation protein R [Bacillus tianshenii]|uniref:Stage II sporulation protein R n=1 Tax=Sutcliffiella tianshenii TaxID=1463404 RepID=A0ABS2NVG7_9BACI|nr:stage II sporulation protein R [Bacillus tianshenii]MBM7618661.1 stage II sporulation protein R [Bacillus tianshenii]